MPPPIYFAVVDADKAAAHITRAEAEAKRLLLSYPGFEATVEEVSAILREEFAAA